MGVFSESLPGEQETAQYRNGRLVLTTHRVHHHRRHEHTFLSLSAVTGTGLVRRRIFLPSLLLIPLGIAFWFTFLAITIMDDYFVFVLIGVPITLPFAFIFHGTVLEVAAQGLTVRERVPRHLRQEALAFLHELEQARHTLTPGNAAPMANAPMPTAVPFMR